MLHRIFCILILITLAVNLKAQSGLNKSCSGGRVCVPKHLCLDEESNNIGGENIIVPRINLDEIDEDDECHYLEKYCSIIDLVDIRNVSSQNEFKGCGYRNVEGIGIRVTQTHNESQYGEFPWMVAIMNKTTINHNTIKLYICGGSLIHPQVVLTTAHWFYQKNTRNILVRAGEWDTQTINEIWPNQDRDISKVKLHQHFINSPLANDIALLFLSQRIDFAPNVQTICLPPSNMLFDGSNCFASGWGKNVFGVAGKYQVIMKKLSLPIVTRSRCVTALTRVISNDHILHDSFICAGGEAGVDTCTGDGGSPLVCPIYGLQERYYQTGIVSYGVGCGKREVPGVYSNVAGFKIWIDQQIRLNGFDTSYYTP